ncbi:MAG: hypothetical protein A3H28_10185 [Acidobacteria bacterium RIFCSPLOWO2_02_FULL_61_28]|nr:MAG: hypothetical protein A3H28_10185 [Acidobacteria bacterium RIFCSPLOWO2_02_FULL_61_28]
MEALANRLTEREVRERLALCSDAQVVDELYDFGRLMLNHSVENTRGLDSKAAQMAAYGGAIVTLLVSTAKAWVPLGNSVTILLAGVAGVSAFVAAIFAVLAMKLRTFDWLGEREWLEDKCFSQLVRLKAFRVLTMWGAMDSHKSANIGKIKFLKTSQRWLSWAVAFILLLLLHIGWSQTLGQTFWIALWKVI